MFTFANNGWKLQHLVTTIYTSWAHRHLKKKKLGQQGDEDKDKDGSNSDEGDELEGNYSDDNDQSTQNTMKLIQKAGKKHNHYTSPLAPTPVTKKARKAMAFHPAHSPSPSSPLLNLNLNHLANPASEPVVISSRDSLILPPVNSDNHLMNTAPAGLNMPLDIINALPDPLSPFHTDIETDNHTMYAIAVLLSLPESSSPLHINTDDHTTSTTAALAFLAGSANPSHVDPNNHVTNTTTALLPFPKSLNPSHVHVNSNNQVLDPTPLEAALKTPQDSGVNKHCMHGNGSAQSVDKENIPLKTDTDPL